ncbi:UDP-glucose--hexose-1-phosphate uridylyltransferase, partial [Bacillus haynesii]|nr:UDP-glucose--hexose-1-phosphate uridylyltransferase [Bacillus haynesii]
MIEQDIAGLIQKAFEAGLIEPADVNYARNQVMNLLGLESFPEEAPAASIDSIPDLLEKLVDYAVEHGVITDDIDVKDMLAANVMNCFVARPSVINAVFQQKYAQSPLEATEYFYQLNKNSNYIQIKRIERNVSYQMDTPYGTMDITINLSKPEKDPEQIKRERAAAKRSRSYPTCLLCKENEGYAGRIGYPARANHRIIKV